MPLSVIDQLRERVRHWIVFVGVRRLVGAVATAIVVMVCGWWLLRSPAPPIETSLPRVGTSIAASTSMPGAIVASSTTVPFITVHVAGAVNEPGVYVLPSTARVIDALRAAGGHTSKADVNAVNLALPIFDSEQIFIPRRGEQTPVSTPQRRTGSGQKDAQASPDGALQGSQKKETDAVININSATATELEQLPGVGPSIAKAIVTYRSTNGPFVVVEDVMKVSGIGPAKFEALRTYITV